MLTVLGVPGESDIAVLPAFHPEGGNSSVSNINSKDSKTANGLADILYYV